MSVQKLTKRTTDAALPGAVRYVIFDTEIHGFGLRVSPTGAKSWIYTYRAGEGGRRTAKKRVTLGSTKRFTPEEAREEAERLRARVNLGMDPQEQKAKQRLSMTVSELAERFLTEHVGAKRKPATKASYEGVINTWVLPPIGSKKAKDVTRTDIAGMHFSMRTRPAQANRTVAIVGSMFGFAFRHGLVESAVNPARGIVKFKQEGRERFLSGAELESLGAAIREAETVGVPWQTDPTKKAKHLRREGRETVIGEHAAAAIRLLVFTGARLREILHLKWDHVDFDRGLLLLPDSKTGKKTIVLNTPALSVLNGLARIGVYVIAGDTAGTDDEQPRADLKRPWTVLTRHAGLKGLRIHDLRHNFASFGVGGGMGLPIIGKLLGHAQPQTTARYAHLDSDPLKKASDAIGQTIAAAMGESLRPSSR
ncbi:MAG: tyrosine-type recombinase/integrase [Devosia sp.]